MSQSGSIVRPRKMPVETRNGNLFIRLTGEFTRAVALKVLAIMAERRNRRGNIFINTEKMTRLLPEGLETFRAQLPGVEAGTLYFIGAGGFGLSPERGRVIIRQPRKKSCQGCGNCGCGQKKSQLAAGLG